MCSFRMQRSITTAQPGLRGLSWPRPRHSTPSCIHTAFAPDPNGRFNDGPHKLRAAENVDDIDVFRHILRCLHRLFSPSTSDSFGFTGNDAVPLRLHVLRNAVGWPEFLAGKAHHGDGLGSCDKQVSECPAICYASSIFEQLAKPRHFRGLQVAKLAGPQTRPTREIRSARAAAFPPDGRNS